MGLKSDIFPIVSASTVTASGNTNTFDLSGYEAYAILVNVTAMSGTSPTFLPFLQVSPDGGTTWYGTATVGPVFAAAAMTATGQLYLGNGNYAGALARLAFTISGTTPSVTYSAVCLARR